MKFDVWKECWTNIGLYASLRIESAPQAVLEDFMWESSRYEISNIKVCK